MEFSPKNPVIQLCLQAMKMEDNNEPENALKTFIQAWEMSSHDLEKFITSFFMARHQTNAAEEIKWLELALGFAQRINDDAVNCALGPIYEKLAFCYRQMNDVASFEKYESLSKTSNNTPTDQGPFYHGTKADLGTGDLLTPGGISNYQDGLKMNHIYFTAMINGAGLAAALAKGEGPDRVYVVEPLGVFEHDPNVTNKKFPGNPTRSYRSEAPLKIIGQVKDWANQSPEDLAKWRKRLDENQGEIIN